MARPPLGRGLVAVSVLDQVVEVLPAEAPLDLGDLALLGQGQRHHDAGLLDRHEGELLVVGRMVQDRDHAQQLIGGHDRGDDALPVHTQMGVGGHLHRVAALGDLAQHALDLRIEEDPRRGSLAGDGLPAGEL